MEKTFENECLKMLPLFYSEIMSALRRKMSQPVSLSSYTHKHKLGCRIVGSVLQSSKYKASVHFKSFVKILKCTSSRAFASTRVKPVTKIVNWIKKFLLKKDLILYYTWIYIVNCLFPMNPRLLIP